MTAGKVKWPREVALGAARDLLRYLKPFCARVKVCGSLRRKRPEVGDVEIVYISRTLPWPDPTTLFAEEQPVAVVDHALELLVRLHVIERRLNVHGSPAWGPLNKLARHRATGVPVDFFATEETRWANTVVCRTGPGDFNTRLASRALEIGWSWNMGGEGFTRTSGPDKGTVRPMKSERDVFAFVGLEYLEPEDRK